jgi:aminoglycoside phosphotransferase (APT) family kinase protein
MVGSAHEELEQGLVRVMNATSITNLQRLSGGASRETWRFTADQQEFVLQRVRPGTIGGFQVEPKVLSAAHRAGVPVAELVVDGANSKELNDPFMIVRAVEGETIARKILRDEKFDTARKVLTSQLGIAAAQLHQIDVSSVPGLVADDQMKRYQTVLRDLGEPHPVFEAAFRWLEINRPESTSECLVHGDYRLGNIMVNDQGLTAILDWELAHIGDPMEDLGWLCVRAWRFGGAFPAAGLGSYDELFDAYASVTGVRPDPDVVRWWEILGTLKWGIICISQAATHLMGIARSHELAAIGRRVCENEYDLIELLARGTQ